MPEIGFDPELPAEKQILKDVMWVPMGDIASSNFSPVKLGKLLKEHAESGFTHHPFFLNGK